MTSIEYDLIIIQQARQVSPRCRGWFAADQLDTVLVSDPHVAGRGCQGELRQLVHTHAHVMNINSNFVEYFDMHCIK